MTDKVLRWRVVEAPTSWHTATGRSGGYTITPRAHNEFYLSYPGGGSKLCESLELAKLHAQCNELAYCLENPEKTHAEPMREFWMVHGVGCEQPRRRHDFEQDAKDEAKRLAAKFPGFKFVVLKSVVAFGLPAIQPDEIKMRPMTREEDENIPF